MALGLRSWERKGFFTGDQQIFTLEEAAPRDVPELVLLDEFCFGERAWSWAAWWEVACWPGWTCLVSRREGELVGAMVLILWPPVAAISSLAVHPRWQRQGLGTKLLKEGILRARRANCRWVALEVDKASPAVQLYRRLGFGVLRRFWEDGIPRLEMVRRLRGLAWAQSSRW